MQWTSLVSFSSEWNRNVQYIHFAGEMYVNLVIYNDEFWWLRYVCPWVRKCPYFIISLIIRWIGNILSRSHVTNVFSTTPIFLRLHLLHPGLTVALIIHFYSKKINFSQSQENRIIISALFFSGFGLRFTLAVTAGSWTAPLMRCGCQQRRSSLIVAQAKLLHEFWP